MANVKGGKGFAAVLLAGMACMIAGFAADLLVHPWHSRPAVPAAMAKATAVSGAGILPFLAHADVAAGQAMAAADCGACHSFDKGGPVLVGPNLYAMVGAPIAAGTGYSFSDALRKVGGDWSFARLNDWLADPAQFAPGTTMSFAGIAAPQERADVIAYLRGLADHPAPLPAPHP